MKKKNTVRTFLMTQAGRLFVASVLMFIIFLAGVGYAFYIDQRLGRTLLGAFFAHALGGRAAGVGLCVAFKMPVFANIFYNMFLEVLIVCFSYSLFSLSMDHYFKSRFLNKALLNAEKNALKYQDVLSRYGWMGVFIFVMIPLPATGPVVGSIIAYFLNFDLKRNFFCIFSGTFVAIVIWTVFFDFLSSHIKSIQGVFAVVGIFVMLYFAKYIRDWFSQDRTEQ
ncbi:MAG: small multi-drug export protein [Desulfobacteraceae bacterium]|nr:small multi-drug export protein [Desulfobacteraceae bacterium]